MCDVRSFRGLWNVIKRLLDQYSIGRERLNQLSGISEGHHCDLIDRFQTIDCFTGGAMCFIAPDIERLRTGRPTINSYHHRERQLILAEVCDLLFDAIFVKLEILLVQTADRARSVFLQHQRIDFDEIDIDLDDFIARFGGWGRRWLRRKSDYFSTRASSVGVEVLIRSLRSD